MALDGSFVVCQTGKITLKSGTSDQVILKGLQGMFLPVGAEASTTELSVVGTRIATLVATGLKYSEGSFDYYYAKGDASQKLLMQYQRAGTQIQDMWFWVDNTDFVALDLINDPSGYMMVGTFSSPQATKNEVFSGNCTILPSGSNIVFDKHISGTTLAFVAGTTGGASITDSGNGFVTAGFEVGDTLILVNVNSLDPLYVKVATVAAGTITLVADAGDEASVPTFSGIASTIIHGGTPVDVTDSF